GTKRSSDVAARRRTSSRPRRCGSSRYSFPPIRARRGDGPPRKGPRVCSGPVSDAQIDSTLQALTREAGDAPHKTRHLVVGRDILDHIGPWLDHQRTTKRDVVVADAATHAAAGAALVERL